MCDESFRLKDAALVCAGRPEQHVVRSVYADAPPHCKPEGKALSRHEACRLHFVKRHGFKGLQKRVGPLEKTAGLFGRAAFFKRLNRHGVVDRKVADARAAKSRQMSAAPKPAPDVLGKHANVRTLGNETRECEGRAVKIGGRDLAHGDRARSTFNRLTLTGELIKALAMKDILKANRIAQYFEKNPKSNPIQMTLPVLFNYFSNLLICYYSKDRSESGLMTALGLRGTYQVKDYLLGMKNYPAMKVFNLISDIRTTDAKSKGVENSSATDADLLKELLYKILH